MGNECIYPSNARNFSIQLALVTKATYPTISSTILLNFINFQIPKFTKNISMHDHLIPLEGIHAVIEDDTNAAMDFFKLLFKHTGMKSNFFSIS